MAEFEITVSEVQSRGFRKWVKVSAGEHAILGDPSVTVRNDNGTITVSTSACHHRPEDVDRLNAVLRRAGEIARKWAAEAEGGAP